MTDREVEEINVLRAVVRQADGINVLQAKLDAVTAERDALQAKLDAVPVADISDIVFRLDTFFDIYHEGVKAQTLTRVHSWLETQVTP